MMNMCVYQSDFKIIEKRQNERKDLNEGQYRFLNKNKVEKCCNKNVKQTTFFKELQRERMVVEYHCIYPLIYMVVLEKQTPLSIFSNEARQANKFLTNLLTSLLTALKYVVKYLVNSRDWSVQMT